MKVLKYIGISVLVLLVLGGILYYPKIKNIQHLLHLFDEDRIVENFRSFKDVWPTSKLHASPTAHVYVSQKDVELPESFEYLGQIRSTAQFLEDSRATGLLIIQDDTIRYENYFLGNTESTQNISWSMAKSYISTLVGIAVEDGLIANVMQDIDKYVPMLKGSAYEGVTIKDVLQMSTGVAFNED